MTTKDQAIAWYLQTPKKTRVTQINMAGEVKAIYLAQPEQLTDSYVQTMPDKCDRIVWRNKYYRLPLKESK